jgi:hypothetical protein
MTDPITAAIVTILGKYVVDKGVELAKEVGPAAVGKAADLARVAFARLRKGPKGQMVAEGFEEDPATYQKPLEKELAAAAQADPDFAGELGALLAGYEEASGSYKASLSGSGAIAQGPGAKAVGERGVMVEGDVGGNIVTGDRSVGGDVVGGDKIEVGDISGSNVAIGRGASAVSGREAPLKFEYPDPVSGKTLYGQVDPAALRQKLATHFSLEEMGSLCFDLDVTAEEIPGETRSERARETLDYFARRGRLPDLLAACRERRKDVDWLGG